MPSYTNTVPDLAAAGPSLQIAIGPSRELISTLTPLGESLSPPLSVATLIDTGAHTTVINPDTVHRLHISPVGRASIVFAIEAPMGDVPYECLIGRDIPSAWKAAVFRR